MKKLVILSLILMLFSAPINSFAEENLTPIMGRGEVSAEQMYLYLISNNKENGLNPIDEDYAREFVITTIKEADTEGVRYDVAFALMMHETGFLNFGGDVMASQNNFGGLGATGGGATGAEFEDMQTGIRGVVQHLKCYASDDELVNECVDTRFADYLRKKAVYVEYLGKADNPNGYGWAVPGKGYGARIVKIIETMKNLDASGVEKIDVYGSDTSKFSFSSVIANIKGDSMSMVMTSFLLFIFGGLIKKYVNVAKK